MDSRLGDFLVRADALLARLEPLLPVLRPQIDWQQSLAAGATAQFSAEHTIRYPKDIELLERQ